MTQDLENRLAKAVASREIGQIMQVLGSVAQTQMGMTELADVTGLSRGNIYKLFRPHSNPTFKTLLTILEVLDLEMEIRPRNRE